MQYTITEDTLGLLLSRYKFSKAIEDLALHLLNDMNIGKAAGTDNISGEFLKNRASILAEPISEICNLSIKY